MKIQSILPTLLAVAIAGSAIPSRAQNLYEDARFGNNNTGGNNADWTLNNFPTNISSLHSSAPGQPAGISVSSCRFATTPTNSTVSFSVSPNNSVGNLNVGSTYVVAVTWPNNTTANQAESPDILVSASDSGMTGIDTLAGITGAFRQGTINSPNAWSTVGLITVNSGTPTLTFTWAGGTTVDRWYADAMQFTPVSALPTAQYWDTGSGLGGSGTWDATTPNWNPNSDGSGTQQAYVQANLAYFGGTASTVNIDPVNGITSDGGLLFASSGYVLQGGPLTLGLGTNIIVTGTNIATINSSLPGANGLSTFGGSGTLILGTTNVIGPVAPQGGILQLTGNSTFGQLAGTGGGVLNLGHFTLNVGDSTANACASVINDGGASSPGSLVKQGTGTLTLTGPSLFHGPTTVNQGTLAFLADATFGAAPSALVANQLALNGNGASLFSIASAVPVINAKRGITVTGSNVIAASLSQREVTFNCPITGNGSITMPCCFPDFNATNTFTGDLLLQLTNNCSIRFNTNNSAGLGTIHVMPLTASGTPCTLRNFAPTGMSTTITNNIFYDESIANAQNYNIDTAGATGTFTLTGSISGKTTGGLNINDNPNSKGNVVISGNNSAFAGGFNLQGGTMTLGSATALGTGLFVINISTEFTATTIALQAAIPLSGASAITNTVFFNAPSSSSTFIIQGSNPIQFSGPVHIGAAGGFALTVSNSAATVISGNIDDQGQNLGLTFNGPGTLTLQGSNSFTGGTTVASGTLDANTANSLPGTTTVNGGTLQIDNSHGMAAAGGLVVNSPGIVNLTYSGSMNIASLTVNGTAQPNGTYGASGNNPGGVFTGSGSLVVGPASTGPTIGTTTISGTTLTLTGSGGSPNASFRVLTSTNVAAPLNSGAWTQFGSGSFDGAGNFNFSGTINPSDAHRFFIVVSP
jgi:autotransporter-associated beta strand protein